MDERRMTFGEHLEELRKRLFYAVVGLIVTVGVALYFQDQLMEFICQPHRKAMRLLNFPDSRFLSGTYTTPFMGYMKLALIVGLVAASPFMMYQIWKFISAGLFPGEKKYVKVYAPMSVVLFLGGCAFSYTVLIPYGLFYLAQYGDPALFEPRYNFSDYLSMVLLLIIFMGFFFELPLVMLFFSNIGLVSPQAYSRWRKFAIIAIFSVNAVVTPSTDIVSLVLISVPMCLLYEAGIIMSYMAYRKKTA